MGFREAIRTLANWHRDQADREEQFLAETRADLYAQWEEDTWCGAFPDRESRDAFIARKQGRAA
jgi:hypothetical protein